MQQVNAFNNFDWVALSPQSYLASLPYPQGDAALSNSQLGKTKSEGQGSRRNTAKNSGTRYRGITHHAKPGRWESHIWNNGTQVYLGGFYIEPQAALAYDLAAIRFRGRDAATTNLPLALFKQELDNLDETSTTEVVMHLRTQSKTMNKVNPGKGVTMQPWELALSDAINGHKVGLGVHGSEGEAARAYDREMIKRHGLQAVEMINFQLADYIDMLDGPTAFVAVQQGLIPADYCTFYILDDAMMTPEGPHLTPAAPMDSQKVARRTSVTPRSVLDCEEESSP